MLHRFGKFRRPVALVMLSVFLVAQLLLPLTARAFFFGGVSLKDEKEMGHKFDVAIRSSLPMVDDPEVSQLCGWPCPPSGQGHPAPTFHLHVRRHPAQCHERLCHPPAAMSMSSPG